MNINRRADSKSGGFTLIEIMISLMIMSMMLVAIATVLTSARRTRDIIFNVQESQLAGPAIMDMIEYDLRGLYVMDRKVLDLLRVEDGALSGMDSDRLDFVTTSNSRTLTPNSQRTKFLRADITEVGYCLRPNPDYPGEFLEIYRREGFGIDEQPFEGGTYTFLHDRIRSFDIQIFAEDGVDAEPLDTWGIDRGDTAHRGVPTRIEIELELEMSPRLINEYSTTNSQAMKRRVLYRRIIHFPASLHLAMDLRPVFRIPVISPPSSDTGGGGGGGNGADFSQDKDNGGGGDGGGGDVPDIDFSGGLGDIQQGGFGGDGGNPFGGG
jgi:prepilin-type N-terminal cleavage/methylation domain-containing protein